jgi:CheY-like chemotaxis protein
MVEMGFYVCGVAATQDRAYSLAASEQPDVVLMDVCLQGGQEGIEAARCLREAAEQRWCSSPAILIGRPWSASTRKCLGHLCWRSRYLMLVLLKSSRASFEAAKRAQLVRASTSMFATRHSVLCNGARY